MVKLFYVNGLTFFVFEKIVESFTSKKKYDKMYKEFCIKIKLYEKCLC